MNKKVSLGLYTGRYVSGSAPMNALSIAWALSHADMWGGTQWRSSCRVDSNRNYLIADFLEKSTADYLFIIDEDMIHPDAAAVVLANRDLPIVSGLYFHRSENGSYAPHFYKEDGVSADERRGHGTAVNNFYRAMSVEVCAAYSELGNLPYNDGPVILTNQAGKPLDNLIMPIDASGWGCIMLRRDALEALDPPYLHDEPGLNGDLAFFKQVKAKGIPVYGDASVICAHNADSKIGLASFYDYVTGIQEASNGAS